MKGEEQSMIKHLSTVGLIAFSWCMPAIAADRLSTP
jgi:hypothetical protein